MNSDEVPGLGGVILDLLPERENKVVHGACSWEDFVSPYFVEEHLPCDYFPLMLKEELKNPEFTC